jgi:hypothetical protein
MIGPIRMESKRVVVWKNEWAPLRRFISGVLDKKNEWCESLKVITLVSK